MARRLVERGVRFVQIYKRGWDQHSDLPRDLALQCQSVDQPDAALILDLKQRGLLDSTLVIWGGEFGRTVFCQGRLSESNYGRDHHPRCFTMWMAGGGIKPGVAHGETDDFSYNVAQDPVSVHDIQATILNQLGVDHKKLTYKYQGRHFRLTDVHGNVLRPILA
jgi:arylsulfatase A-like enzyme